MLHYSCSLWWHMSRHVCLVLWQLHTCGGRHTLGNPKFLHLLNGAAFACLFIRYKNIISAFIFLGFCPLHNKVIFMYTAHERFFLSNIYFFLLIMVFVSRNVTLKGQCHEIFDLSFPNSKPSGPLINRLKWFFLNICFREDIRI